jgi:probable phosphomutase (TIGR03848 family)
MALLLLIRHGHNDLVGKKLAGRLPGVHLNQTGQCQARRLAAELAGFSIRSVIASPLERAQETAAPIALVHGLSVEVLPELMEIDFGAWQGKSLKQLKRRKLWKDIQDHPSKVCFPDGESFSEAQSRVTEGLLRLSEKYGEKDQIVCVSHSDVIKLAVAYFLDMSLDNFQRLQITPASVTFLFLHQGNVSFGPINHTFDRLKIN